MIREVRCNMSENQFESFLDKNKGNLDYLNRKDRRMRFNNAKDPIYFAFDFVENRPISSLIKDFFNDLVYEIKKIFTPKKK